MTCDFASVPDLCNQPSLFPDPSVVIPYMQISPFFYTNLLSNYDLWYLAIQKFLAWLILDSISACCIGTILPDCCWSWLVPALFLPPPVITDYVITELIHSSDIINQQNSCLYSCTLTPTTQECLECKRGCSCHFRLSVKVCVTPEWSFEKQRRKSHHVLPYAQKEQIFVKRHIFKHLDFFLTDMNVAPCLQWACTHKHINISKLAMVLDW